MGQKPCSQLRPIMTKPQTFIPSCFTVAHQFLSLSFYFLLPSIFFWVFIVIVFSTSSFPMPGTSGVLSLLCLRCLGAWNWKLFFSRADFEVTSNLKLFNHHFWILMLLYTERSNIEHWADFNTLNTIIEVFFLLENMEFIFFACFLFCLILMFLLSTAKALFSLLEMFPSELMLFSYFLFCPIFVFNWLATFSSSPADISALKILFPAYHLLICYIGELNRLLPFASCCLQKMLHFLWTTVFPVTIFHIVFK